MTNDPLTDHDNIELWVSRAALETVVTAALAYAKYGNEGNVIPKITAAVNVIQDAVHDAFEDPLDTNLF